MINGLSSVFARENKMEVAQFFYLSGTILISTVCITWLIFFATKMLSSHTDIGKGTKKKKEKSKNIQETKDDIPQVDLNLFKKPKIETSFGDRRIGEVHEHEKKT